MLRRERFWEWGLRGRRSHDNGIGVRWDKGLEMETEWTRRDLGRRREEEKRRWWPRWNRKSASQQGEITSAWGGGGQGFDHIPPSSGPPILHCSVGTTTTTRLASRNQPPRVPRSARITSVEKSTFLSAGMVKSRLDGILKTLVPPVLLQKRSPNPESATPSGIHFPGPRGTP